MLYGVRVGSEISSMKLRYSKARSATETLVITARPRDGHCYMSVRPGVKWGVGARLVGASLSLRSSNNGGITFVANSSRMKFLLMMTSMISHARNKGLNVCYLL